jgi:MtN3 and saliva related transmembrane protein
MAIGAATIVGTAAAIASTTSFVPQAIKVIRTRDTSSISSGMYLITVIGFTLWTCYGALQSAWPIIASNGVCLALSAFILAMKLLPPHAKEKVAEAIEPVLPSARSAPD